LPKHMMEQFDPSTWETAPFSTAVSSYTYTWDTKKYGGTGSYTAFGPVGAGPYKMVSFDPTTNTAVLKKWPGYWNTTGLEALGQFTIETYRLIWINDKDSAIAAFKNGEVNMLDENYAFNPGDLATLTGLGATIVKDPEPYWQELQFNLRHPIWGTGTDTPLGKSDPSKAAEAARDVRDAVSHLIPRQLIVDSLLGGLGTPLAGPFGPACGVWANTNLQVDAFDFSAAADDLRAAGYTVNVAPPAQIESSGSTFLGTGTVTLSGTTGVAKMMVVIQQSTDNMTWTPVAAAVADNSSKYSVSVPGPPAFGSIMYRANFTGYTAPNASVGASITPALVNQIIDSGQMGGGKQLIPEIDTNTITVSSATNDTMTVSGIVLVIIAVVAAAAIRMRKKKQAP